MLKRKGKWTETYTGRKFWPLDPRPNDICIEDIAHGLTHICRYSGQCCFFFSVAQHSLNCMYYTYRQNLSRRYQLLALLHDGAEAYISDLPKPLKSFLPTYKKIEDNIQNAIYNAFCITPPNDIEKEVIQHADEVMLVTEAQRLMPFNGWNDLPKLEPDKATSIAFEDFEDIEFTFLISAKSLLESRAENLYPELNESVSI